MGAIKDHILVAAQGRERPTALERTVRWADELRDDPIPEAPEHPLAMEGFNDWWIANRARFRWEPIDTYPSDPEGPAALLRDDHGRWTYGSYFHGGWTRSVAGMSVRIDDFAPTRWALVSGPDAKFLEQADPKVVRLLYRGQ